MQLTQEDLEVFVTEDGSSTLRRKDSGLLYRSAQGASKESISVFVEGTHLPTRKAQWKVFELGFGGGCNFANTLSQALHNGVKLHYEAVDHLPIHPSYAQHHIVHKILQHVRSSRESVTLPLPNGTLTLHPHPFAELICTEKFHAIFHDPFGPHANPTCWTEECFEKEFSLLHDDGVWSSYGAAGHIRRALANVGFFVAIGNGIGRKRETTRAAKDRSLLNQYKIKYQPKLD